MLSSIHPLGERGRGNRWALTVAAFAVGSSAAGGLVGAMLAVAGSVVNELAAPRLFILAVATGGAAVLDWLRIAPLGPHRQVNERWIGAYRGWVYGIAFGAQLGAGGTTYVVTWLVYAAALAAGLAGSVAAGAVIGLTFGAIRALPVVAARWIDRPSRLGAFHRRMADLGPVVRVGSATTALAVAFLSLGAAL